MSISPVLYFKFIEKKDSKENDFLLSIIDDFKNRMALFLNKKEASIDVFLKENIDLVFRLRMGAIRWIINNEIDIDEQAMINEFSELEDLKSNYVILNENTLFAFRVLKKVNQINIKLPINLDININSISYHSFVCGLSFLPNDELFSKIKQLFDNSLALELGIMMSYFVLNDYFEEVANEKVNELTRFVANYAHNLGASIKMLSPNKKEKVVFDSNVNNNYKKEMQELAELGILEYSQNLQNYDL